MSKSLSTKKRAIRAFKALRRPRGHLMLRAASKFMHAPTELESKAGSFCQGSKPVEVT